MVTTSTALATPTPTGPPRVLTAFTRDRLVPLPCLVLVPWPLLVLVCLVWPAVLLATPDLLEDRFSRGRLSMSPPMPLPLPTILLAVMDTTSMVPATPTPTGPPRVSTRGRLSPA